jgi:hypothetical protein
MSIDGPASDTGRLDLEARPLATDVRSTLILASMQTLRSHGAYDRYVAAIDPAVRERLITLVAGVWIPMSLALAHYDACEALALPLTEQVAMGHGVGARVQGTLLGIVVRAARGAGATPWTPLGHLDRLWDRVFAGGGGARLAKLGPKEARVDLIGLPLLDVPYFRHAYRGTFHGAIELLCKKAYVHEVRAPDAPSSASFRVSWV